MPQKEVGQIVTCISGCRSSTEGPLSVRLLIVRGIELLLTAIEAKRDLMRADRLREVVGDLIIIDVEIAWSARSARHIEVVADRNLNIVVSHVIADIHSQSLRAKQI